MRRSSERGAGPAATAEEGADRGSTVRLRHFSRSLPMLLLRARESVMRHFRESLRQFGLTEQQWRVLRALGDVTEIEVTALATATFLLTPSLSRILRDLESKMLIRRRVDAADQRRSVVRISPAGAALIEQVSPHSERIYGSIGARFGPEKLALLQDLLRELEAAMQTDLPTQSGAAAPVEDAAADVSTPPSAA